MVIYIEACESGSMLEDLLPNLQQIADTLVLLELDSVSKVVQEQISKIKSAAQNNEGLDEVVLKKLHL